MLARIDERPEFNRGQPPFASFHLLNDDFKPRREAPSPDEFSNHELQMGFRLLEISEDNT